MSRNGTHIVRAIFRTKPHFILSINFHCQPKQDTHVSWLSFISVSHLKGAGLDFLGGMNVRLCTSHISLEKRFLARRERSRSRRRADTLLVKI